MRTITMKGKTNHNFGLIIAGDNGGSERPLMATSNDEYHQISGRDGTRHRAGGLNNNVITVNFIKRNNSPQQWQNDRRDIVGWLHSKDEIRIEFDDEPGVHYIGKVTSSEVPTAYTYDMTFSVEFTVQPFRYSDVIKETLTFTDNKTTINNRGNYEAQFNLKLTVQTGASKLDFGVGDALLTYNGSVGNGDIVTIDTDLLELRINDVLKVLEVTGAFERIQPGVNTITSTVRGLHELTYQERSI